MTEHSHSVAPTESVDQSVFDETAPSEFVYVLLERDGELLTWELCERDQHRCERVDGELHCVDCDFIEPLPDDGAQTKLGGQR
jgi:hypothetical protein